jgi:hypothetical protein
MGVDLFRFSKQPGEHKTILDEGRRVKLWRIGLVHRVISRRHTVGFKRVWMQA